MRKITPVQITIFAALMTTILAISAGTAVLIYLALPAGDLRGVAAFVLFVPLYHGVAIGVFRAFLGIAPLPAGEIPVGSRAEAVYHVYLLFFLIVFYPVMKSNLVPVPLMRAVYLALGARLGENSYSGGILFDPPFIKIGANTIVGQGALLIPHVIEGERLAHYPIRLGNNVTIGANAVVLSDVEIGDGALVAIGSVVPKGTKIGPGEVWAGMPAKRIK